MLRWLGRRTPNLRRLVHVHRSELKDTRAIQIVNRVSLLPLKVLGDIQREHVSATVFLVWLWQDVRFYMGKPSFYCRDKLLFPQQQPKFSMSHHVLLSCKLYVPATTACAMSPQHASYAYTLLGSLQGPYGYTMATAWTKPSKMCFYFTLKFISHLFGTTQCVCKYLNLSLICYECVQFQLDIYEELAVV